MPSAKYDRVERIKWYRQVDYYHRPVKEVCQIFGISRKCYYKWRKRDFGKSGNTYVPFKNQPNLKLTWEIRKFIEEQKLKTNYGPLKMKMLLKKKLNLDLSTTIIYRYYRKRKLIRRPQKKLPWYEPLKYHLIVEKPGEGVQMDVKYVYIQGVRHYQFSVFDPFTEKYQILIQYQKEKFMKFRKN